VWEEEDVESIGLGDAGTAVHVKSTGRDVHAVRKTPSAANPAASPVDAGTLEMAGSSSESPHGWEVGATLAVDDVAA